MLGELPIYVDEPAEYEPRGDNIVCIWKGNEFVMPIAVAKKAVARLNKALDRWHEGSPKVVQFRRH